MGNHNGKMEKGHSMKILVTGSCGFIGHHTCLKLLELGFQVIGIDNLNNYYDVKLKKYRLDILKKHNGYIHFYADITSPLLKTAFNKNHFDCVIHLAGQAGVRCNDIRHYYEQNLYATMNLVENMNCTKIIMASTSSIYSAFKPPFVETSLVGNFKTPYAASKKAAEDYLQVSSKLHGLDATVLRFFTVYGPAGRPDMSIFRIINWIDNGKEIQLYGDGRQARDFTYIDDIVAGIINSIPLKGFEIINLGGGKKPTSMLEIIQLIGDCLMKPVKIKFHPANNADIKTTQADISKAKQLLCWAPKVEINHGLRRCVLWHDETKHLKFKI